MHSVPQHFEKLIYIGPWGTPWRARGFLGVLAGTHTPFVTRHGCEANASAAQRCVEHSTHIKQGCGTNMHGGRVSQCAARSPRPSFFQQFCW